jgi:DNA polymerase I-like protein with 3'-5' exonuclease and polymerase domains
MQVHDERVFEIAEVQRDDGILNIKNIMCAVGGGCGGELG